MGFSVSPYSESLLSLMNFFHFVCSIILISSPPLIVHLGEEAGYKYFDNGDIVELVDSEAVACQVLKRNID